MSSSTPAFFSLYLFYIFHRNGLKLGMMSPEQKKFKLRLVASITYYVCHSVFPIYLSHFSSDWTEIWHEWTETWHDDSLDGMKFNLRRVHFMTPLSRSLLYVLS